MIAAVLRVAVWIGVIDGLAALAVLGFLYTPESNVLMLSLSAVLVIVATALLLLSSTSGAIALVQRLAPWKALGTAARRLPLVLVAIVVVGLLCGAAGWFESWWVARAGQVDAAAIAAGDVTNTRPLHATVHWLVVVVQWILVPAWLATALAWIAGYERRDVLGMKWLTAGLHWRILLVTAASVIVLVWLPWRVVYWRPRGLPASSLEMGFTVVKLGLIYLLSQVAWAIALATAARRVTAPAVVPVTVADP
jgi:hypothetical protein